MPRAKGKRSSAARGRAAESAAVPTQSSTFPIDRLPPELVHSVFSYLKPTETANFRLLCWSFAQIGLEYLVPCLYLQIDINSYERLIAMSRHPIVSKYVKWLEYEVDCVKDLGFQDWEQNLYGREYLAAENQDPPVRPPANASQRTWRAFDRATTAIDSMPRHRFKASQLEEAFMIYLELAEAQEHIRTQACHGSITEVMKLFPKLKGVRMSRFGAFDRYGTQIEDKFGAGYKFFGHQPELARQG